MKYNHRNLLLNLKMKKIGQIFTKAKSFIRKILLKTKLILAILFIVIFTLLALPRISFQINEQTYVIPEFSIFPQDQSRIGNFKKGKDVFNSIEATARINFDSQELDQNQKIEVFNETKERVQTRLRLVGMYDVDLRGEIEGDEYRLVLNYPEYYQQVFTITNLLTRRGEITFVNSQATAEIDFQDSDINSNIEVGYLPGLQSHFRFTFPESKSLEIQQALVDRFFLMSVDGTPEVQIFQYDQSDLTNFTLRGLPNTPETIGDIAFRDTYINIIRTYFNEEAPLEFSLSVDESLAIIPPNVNELSVRFIALFSLTMFVALTIVTLIKYRFSGAIFFLLASATYLSLTITLLKYISAPLSLASILTYLVLTGITSILIWRMLEVDNTEEMKFVLKKIRHIGIMIVVISLFTLRFIPELGRTFEIFATFLIFGLSYLLLGLINFKVLIENLILNNNNNAK